MHVSDALISPGVAAGTGAVAIGLIALASKKIKNIKRPDLIPLMGVMGAFVFAAQMINFTIPGTGSSGHLIGGIFLSAILGPWCGFITLCSILIVQCLLFADGGLLALGCNILNMAAVSCLLAYPLIYKPICGKSLHPARIVAASLFSSIFALELGAFAVTIETELSRVTALPFLLFIKFMLPIHLVIGAVEGIVTSALILFLASYRPAVLNGSNHKSTSKSNNKLKPALIVFSVLTLILGGAFSILASEYPDGLEWSMEKVAGATEFSSTIPTTAIMPEYNSNFAGIIGAAIVMALLWVATTLLRNNLNKKKG